MKQRTGKKRTAHIVSHTHWDREWRFPIWETRLMLLDFMDELVEVLESGKYPGFLMDGQVSPVLDYLEVRPEMAGRVKSLVQADKLQVGPWLYLPDEYPVDGECMVRNLLWGHRRAAELGKVFNVGYTSFGWGQTAQLPQIYAGFGMDVAMIGKRVGKHRAPRCEFLWRGPDGSELLATRFGELGRQNFYFKVHLSALFGVDHEGPEWVYHWADGGVAFHRADPEQMEQDHARVDAPARWFPETITPEMIEAVWDTMRESVLADDRLMMNGCDYTASQPLFPEMVERLNEVDPDPNRQWVHTTMTEYVRLMRRRIVREALTVVEGELRDGPAMAVTGNALTTRLYIKRLNKHAQNMLLRFAEPLSAAAAMAGAPYQDALLRKAWEFLLAAHPHDSINGVTQDKTAQDVADRLNQVVDLSQSLGNRAMQELVRRIDTSAFADGDVLLVAFNPLPYARREVVEAYVNMPADPVSTNWPFMPEALQLFDADGAPLGTQWMGFSRERYCVGEVHTRAFPFECLRHRLFFDTGEVPPGGYKVFRAGTRRDMQGDAAPWSDSLARTHTLLQTPNVLENAHLRVEMQPNGTFDLHAKRLNAVFRGLNYYEDRGEHGDYWINHRPMFDAAHTSLGCAARIWSEEAGPMQATLASEITMTPPRKGNKELQRRGDDEADLTIRTAVTLRADEECVEVNVSFENRHEDHFLRVMFPTGLSGAMFADAGGHFIVDRRPIRPQGPTPDSAWPDMGTLPHNHFVDLSDGALGMAFLNDSLMEYEVLDNAERTVALSLLRAVRNWLCTETRVGSGFPSQKGGQCLGRHDIRYAIYPHAGDWREANVPLAAERFNAPLRLVQTRANKGALPAKQASLFAVDNPALRFSALKKAEDRNTFLLRLYNPTAEPLKGSVTFAAPVKQAWAVSLNERREQPLAVKRNHEIPVEVSPYKIISVEIQTR
ncbi:MAG: alpha-mannosidase [Candidatus Hydrogenedentes bacterium]|nr:alpha-mannosidase [Candidatus Hydrogenedentota bacterium]